MKLKCGPWVRYLTDTHPLVDVRPCSDWTSSHVRADGSLIWFQRSMGVLMTYGLHSNIHDRTAIRAIILGIFLFRPYKCQDTIKKYHQILQRNNTYWLNPWILNVFGDGNSNYWCTGRKSSNFFSRFLRNRSLKLLWRVRGRRTGIWGFEDLDGPADAEKTGKTARRDGHLP